MLLNLPLCLQSTVESLKIFGFQANNCVDVLCIKRFKNALEAKEFLVQTANISDLIRGVPLTGGHLNFAQLLDSLR